jgi:predicted AAA+ superfamily ATPase
MEKILEEVIGEFHKEGIPGMFRREVEVPLDINKAVSFIGLRRSGKTYILYQIAGELMKKARKEEIFYINFEDERLEGISRSDLSTIVELYYKKNPDAKKRYFLFDEIQEISGWEKFLRRLLEKSGYRIFITGSSSKMLSKEISTALRGRSLPFRIFPLSFREYLNAKEITFEPPLIEKERGRIKEALDQYLQFGGFPEILNFPRSVKTRTLREYTDMIIYRDLVERYGIEKIGAMKFLMKSVAQNFSKEISIRKLHNFLISSNVGLSKNKVYEYFSYLEDAGFVYVLRKFGHGVREVEGSVPKIYIADVGFASVYGKSDTGRRFENVVAIELMRRKSLMDPLMEPTYFRTADGSEVDFVVSEGSKVRHLIQVCYNLDDMATKDRELRSLLKASKELKCNDLLVITGGYEGEEKHKGKTVNFIPLWKWLLETGHHGKRKST